MIVVWSGFDIAYLLWAQINQKTRSMCSSASSRKNTLHCFRPAMVAYQVMAWAIGVYRSSIMHADQTLRLTIACGRWYRCISLGQRTGKRNSGCRYFCRVLRSCRHGCSCRLGRGWRLEGLLSLCLVRRCVAGCGNWRCLRLVCRQRFGRSRLRGGNPSRGVPRQRTG